jgi:hypothetical protein
LVELEYVEVRAPFEALMWEEAQEESAELAVR